MFHHSACPRLQLVSAVAVLLSAAVSSGYAQSADEDLVAQLPGFKVAPFKVFSGYLEVPGPFQQNGYDSLSIHYQVPLISFRATLSYTYACCTSHSNARPPNQCRTNCVPYRCQEIEDGGSSLETASSFEKTPEALSGLRTFASKRQERAAVLDGEQCMCILKERAKKVLSFSFPHF